MHVYQGWAINSFCLLIVIFPLPIIMQYLIIDKLIYRDTCKQFNTFMYRQFSVKIQNCDIHLLYNNNCIQKSISLILTTCTCVYSKLFNEIGLTFTLSTLTKIVNLFSSDKNSAFSLGNSLTTYSN